MTKSKKNTKLTPKQAAVAATNILRGLDNSIKEAQRGVEKLTAFRERVGSLTSGLSNLASAAPAKAAPVKAATKQAAPPKPSKKAAPAKKAAPVKASAPAKPAVKAAVKPAKPAAAVKSAKEGSPKAPVKGRPSLREAVKETLRVDGKGTPTEVYDRVTGKWGYWSKQSLYVLINKDPEIVHADGMVDFGKAKAPAKAKSDKVDAVDALVGKVEQDRATAAVV